MSIHAIFPPAGVDHKQFFCHIYHALLCLLYLLALGLSLQKHSIAYYFCGCQSDELVKQNKAYLAWGLWKTKVIVKMCFCDHGYTQT